MFDRRLHKGQFEHNRVVVGPSRHMRTGRALTSHAMTTMVNGINLLEIYLTIVFKRMFGLASGAVVMVTVVAFLAKVF